MIAAIFAAAVMNTPLCEDGNGNAISCGPPPPIVSASRPFVMVVTPSGSLPREVQSLPSDGRTFMWHGGRYLNIGDRGLLMDAGRCTYSTVWNGKDYADQDFDQGPGIGRPRKGAKPC